MWSCKPQDWALEATKAYEEASSAVQIPKPPNRVGREANLHWRSPKRHPHKQQYPLMLPGGLHQKQRQLHDQRRLTRSKTK
ncbi:hypothetical protein HanPSC8_Chr08g0346851 [Helianthus annuus]|nr:hypothetical protein HanPSC8_Chr08g0346851 [Helianthus annuus]